MGECTKMVWVEGAPLKPTHWCLLNAMAVSTPPLPAYAGLKAKVLNMYWLYMGSCWARVVVVTSKAHKTNTDPMVRSCFIVPLVWIL